MKYEIVEEAIRTKIASVATQADVVVLPEVDEDYQRAVDKPRVTVSYAGSDFGTMGGNNKVETRSFAALVVHAEEGMFQCVLQARKLRGADGIYKLINDVLKAVVGFAPDDCEKIRVAKFGLVEREAQVFSYALHLVTTSILLEEQDPQNEEISLIEINSNKGTSTTPNNE